MKKIFVRISSKKETYEFIQKFSEFWSKVDLEKSSIEVTVKEVAINKSNKVIKPITLKIAT